MITVSSFNMYKGGSRTLYDSIRGVLYARSDVIDVTFRNCAITSRTAVQVPYPIRHLNFLYRLLLEQLFVPFLAYVRGTRRLVMLGNFPCFFWHRDQSVLCHNTLYLEATPERSSLKVRLELSLFRFLITHKKATFYVQSPAVATAFLRRFPSVPDLRVIGAPAPFPRRSSPVHSEATGHPLQLVYPAHAHPHKNHAFLFRAASAFLDEGVVVTLTIAPQDLRDPPSSSAPFRFVGNQDPAEMRALYARSSAVVFPSMSESLGLPLLEAAQLELPVLAPRLPYVDAAITNYYGYIADDPISFAGALKALTQDVRAGSPMRPASPLLRSPEAFVRDLLQ